jgi:hypothetical protein
VNITRGTTRIPEERGVRSTPPVRRLYYRSAAAAVTEHWFVTPDRRYVVAQLEQVRITRGAYDPVAVGAAGAATAVVAAVGVSLSQLSPMAWPAMIAFALTAVTVAGVTWRLRPRPFEIWAEYRGVVVRLFQSTDEKTFGHVCRALIRALEFSAAESAEDDEYVPAA